MPGGTDARVRFCPPGHHFLMSEIVSEIVPRLCACLGPNPTGPDWATRLGLCPPALGIGAAPLHRGPSGP